MLIPTAFRITGFLSTFAGECSSFLSSFVVEWNWPARYAGSWFLGYTPTIRVMYVYQSISQHISISEHIEAYQRISTHIKDYQNISNSIEHYQRIKHVEAYQSVSKHIAVSFWLVCQTYNLCPNFSIIFSTYIQIVSSSWIDTCLSGVILGAGRADHDSWRFWPEIRARNEQ